MLTDEEIIKLTFEAIDKLDEIFTQLILHKDGKYQVTELGMSISRIRKFQSSIFEYRPDLIPETNEEVPVLTDEQIEYVSKLTKENLKIIDDMLLSFVTNNWHKVAFVVGSTMVEISEQLPELPDIYYAQRVKYIAGLGGIESEGDLDFMCYSEIRHVSKNKT